MEQMYGIGPESIRLMDGYINWTLLVKNARSMGYLKQSLTLALDRMEV
jgi:Ca2+-binding EF-hand superfamily protein